MNAQSNPGRPAWYDEAIAAAGTNGPEMDAEAINAIVTRWQTERGVAQDRRIVGAAIRAARKQIGATVDDADDAVEQGFFELRDALNTTHFILHMGSGLSIGHYETDIVERPFGRYTRPRLVLQTRRQFVEANEHIWRPITASKQETLGESWLRWQDRRTFTGLQLSTQTDAQGRLVPPVGAFGEPLLNLWLGWPVKPKEGDFAPFLRYVRDVLASGNEVNEVYILNWLAWVVQNPARQIGVMLGFIGPQGVGKGVMGNFLTYLFGSHGLNVTQANQIVGKHNDHLMGCCLLFADEALFAGKVAEANILKGLITERNLTVEPKFMPIIKVENHMSIIAATNHDHGFHVEAGDRRHAVFYVEKAEERTKEGYWEPLLRWIYSDEGTGAVLHMLLQRDLTGFDAERDRPTTEALTDQMQSSFRDDDVWWDRAAMPFLIKLGETGPLPGSNHGEMETGDRGWAEWVGPHGARTAGIKIHKAKAYSAYLIWRSRQSEKQYTAPGEGVFWRNARQKWLGIPPGSYGGPHIVAEALILKERWKKYHK